MGNSGGALGAEISISSSFTMLQRVAASFGELRRGHPILPRRERTMLRMVTQLGTTAVPLCVRELRSTNDDRVRWAYALLYHLADTAELRPRVIEAMRQLATRPDVDDASKLRALALLSELDEGIPETEFHDLQEVHNRSVRQLADCLTNPAEVAQAAEMLVGQLEDEELANFVDQLATMDPSHGELLIDELLARDDIDEGVLRELRRVRSALAVERSGPSLRLASRRKTHVTIGHREDGCTIIVACQRRANTRPVRWRSWCCTLSAVGALTDALHEDDYTPGLLKKQIIQPLEAEGFVFSDIDLKSAAQLVADAARATHDNGEPLPRGFYLGRDLLRLHNEHQRDAERDNDELASLLARGLDLMQRQSHDRARPLLERYVAQIPADPAGRAALGVCLLVTNQLRHAYTQLQRAAWLEPDNPLHYWNLASVAHRQGRLGGCYQCFSAYVQRGDEGADSRARRRLASEFICEYERLARLEFPDGRPSLVARAEEQIYEARFLAKDGNLDQAVVELRKAVRVLPSHHPSWSYLATLYNEREQLAQAKRCAQRAAELCPSDVEVSELLDLVLCKLSAKKRLAKRPVRRPNRTHTATPKTVE